jgi:hypothetical protein
LKAVDLRKMGLIGSFEPESLFAHNGKVSAATVFCNWEGIGFSRFRRWQPFRMRSAPGVAAGLSEVSPVRKKTAGVILKIVCFYLEEGAPMELRFDAGFLL